MCDKKSPSDETKCVGWQPIDTAPKDGSRILAYFDYNPIYRESSERWFVAVVRWTGDYGMWSMPGTGGLSPKLWQPIRYPNDPTLKANSPHKCKGCGAEGEPGSPDYCSADCLDNAMGKSEGQK